MEVFHLQDTISRTGEIPESREDDFDAQADQVFVFPDARIRDFNDDELRDSLTRIMARVLPP